MQRFLAVLFHLFIRLLKIACILKICCFSPRFCELQQQRNYMLGTTSQDMVFPVYFLVLYPACRLGQFRLYAIGRLPIEPDTHLITTLRQFSSQYAQNKIRNHLQHTAIKHNRAKSNRRVYNVIRSKIKVTDTEQVHNRHPYGIRNQ